MYQMTIEERDELLRERFPRGVTISIGNFRYGETVAACVARLEVEIIQRISEKNKQ